MRKLLTIGMMLFIIGCNKKDGSHRMVNVLHEVEDVSLSDAPREANIKGHIDGLVPVVFSLEAKEVKVWIKEAQNASWEVLRPLRSDQRPTYVYDQQTYQLRFQNCYEGWGYAISIKK